ncbi:Rne/Rng family ribonuclease [Tessaracoccus sp. OH4464_COT-324]|uniref:Rne/Rng family ribonuclease n=1 Tax=Tessaracoccus sp. OH4464_COT-324 TaxID=2491059 RepID=UPI000F631C86|nr:Rne/Rng family ribonuclease [Tessaracoccus sp. OH4464_COT-324]RRD46281.1 Rne/Rng family ribonuclease [Tessaracoccus sp. OH4464_COT-324]
MAESEATEPTRRRRAASRPAGPPVEVEVTPVEAVTGLAAPVTGVAVVAESPAPSPRSARRRASRKAAPAGVDAEVVVTAADAPVADEAAEALAQAEEKPKRRRSRKVEATPAPQADPEEDKGAAPALVELPAPVQEEKPKRTVRRRASRKAAPADADAEVVVTAEEPPKQEPIIDVAAPAAEEKPKRRRSRKTTEPEPEPVAQEAESTDEPQEPDEIDEIALALAEAQRVAQQRIVANPFMTDADRDTQLAALAGAIAAGEDPEVPGDAEQEADAEEGAQDDAEEAEDSDEERPSRRRRRRGGRRRRRAGKEDSEDESDEAEEPAEGAEEPGEEDEAASEESGTTRRRRRRRRRSSGSDEAESTDDEVTGIEGSTRMEAKRQRRKESRAAGRRRAPILSEAEFLARRESVARKMIVRQGEDYTQLAVLEDDILVEHYVDRPSASSLIGNIYLGKVQNVLPSMEAAFIDIGRGRNAVLYAGEVDWDSFGVTGEDRKVENVLKSGQSIVVQVTKDPIGQKGARLTHHISLPGRYIVYSPGGHLSGISRKLPDTERSRLRDILSDLIGDDESVIVRTAAEGVGEEDLVRDVNRLKAQWEIIEKRAKQGGAPQALYAEPDLTLRIIRDLFTGDFGEIIVQGDGGQEDAFEAISAYVSHVAPGLIERVHRFEVGEDGKDVFARNRIDEQIAKALERKVFLPSGGSLVIDRTEAMTVIDVNTGRFTGSGGNLEATVTSNNLEAAEEIVRQLRLRDLGGIIVIDFIDMVLPSNRELLLRRLVECLGRDRTRHQVAEVTSLGLVQLTRKRIGTGLAEAFTEECETCHGQGYHRFEEPVDSQAPADGGDRATRRRRKR